MRFDRLKVIVLTHGGAERVLELLAGDSSVEIVGVFVETEVEKQRGLFEIFKRSIRYDGFAATLRKILSKIAGRGEKVNEDPSEGLAPRSSVRDTCDELKLQYHEVRNYHDPTSIDLIENAKADLGIVYGTNILKEPVFSLPRLGCLNIHQGLAPKYRGGPTVFWELFNDEREIGITVHFVAAKVDTGDIVLQQTIPLAYDFAKYGTKVENFLNDLRQTLKEPSARLMAEAVHLIATGKAQPIKQDPGLGKRYRLPLKTEKDELVRRLIRRHKKQQGQTSR